MDEDGIDRCRLIWINPHDEQWKADQHDIDKIHRNIAKDTESGRGVMRVGRVETNDGDRESIY